MAETRKLIDRVDVIKDIDQNLTPKYFPGIALDKNRVGVYGWLTEALATSIEDTITLEQRRAADYCPELSTSEIRVNQTAKIRGVSKQRATPGKCFAFLGVLKSDILSKGQKYNSDEIRFVIDRRSTILYGGVNFSLEDDIVIRAVKRGTGYLYAANYSGEHSTYESYIQTYEYINSSGEELVAMVCQIYQCRYNISEQHVTDELEFLYDGKYFDYKDKLAGFEVYYRKSSTDTYKKADLEYYLTMQPASTKCLFYNDDESNLLRITNNEYMNIGVNSVIRVEIKETLGAAGNEITVNGTDKATFSMYQDPAYNYSGVHVFINMLSDVTGGSDGDSIDDLRKRLIDAKTVRENITTEHDIINYINDVDANIQLVKKRNDLQDRTYFMYTLLRYGDRRLAPATTKNLVLYYETVSDRKVIPAYSKFKLVPVVTEDPTDEGYPDADYVIRVDETSTEITVSSEDELSKLTADAAPNGTVVRVLETNGVNTINDTITYEVVDSTKWGTDDWRSAIEKAFYLTCPYMIILDDLNMASYYFSSVDEEVALTMRSTSSLFPYQMITRGISIYRDSHDPDSNDTYTYTIRASMNTENDSLLVYLEETDEEQEDGTVVHHDQYEIIDPKRVMCHVFFPLDGNPAAYLPMQISSYDPESREFAFTGTTTTRDYITELETLEMTGGLFRIGTTNEYTSTVDYKNGSFQVSFMFNQEDPSGTYPRDDVTYSLLPEEWTSNYVLMNSYYNNPNNLYNLILEFNKFSRSATTIDDTTVDDMKTAALKKALGTLARWQRTEFILRQSKNDDAAIIGLMAEYNITRAQALAIINTKFQIFEKDYIRHYTDDDPDPGPDPQPDPGPSPDPDPGPDPSPDPETEYAPFYLVDDTSATNLNSTTESMFVFTNLDGTVSDLTLGQLFIGDEPIYQRIGSTVDDTSTGSSDNDDGTTGDDEGSTPEVILPGTDDDTETDDDDQPVYQYNISAVPFFEYKFGVDNTAALYPIFKNMAEVYGSLLKLTTDFEVALKFIATYGPSKYITVHGGVGGESEVTVHLNDLNPTLYFKVYGFGAPVDDIYNDIYEYLRDNYNTEVEVFMSNVCTMIEKKYSSVKSIKFMGINQYDGSYQHIAYNQPTFTNRDIITRYVPEQLSITDIHIELDES